MKITDLKVQLKNNNRVNVFIDNQYRLSLDIYQINELGIKINGEISSEELECIEEESLFGKVYIRALEYCLLRPRSKKEVKDYLYNKTLTKKIKLPKTGKVVDKKGISLNIADRVLNKLIDKNYVNDVDFTKYWVNNRFQKKGISSYRLKMELLKKGIEGQIIEDVLANSERQDSQEILKIIAKKRLKYDDQKLKNYLLRQGFAYDDIREAIESQSFFNFN